MQTEALVQLVVEALEELKAKDIRVLDVRRLTSITDVMVIASGTSDRHVRSLADHITESAKRAGVQPYGVEGKTHGEWVLVDLMDVVAHIMLPDVRAFYELEKIWAPEVASRPRPKLSRLAVPH
jgi:ribosome-associated protein